MRGKVIDKTDPIFEKFPATLHGQILLEEVYGVDGLSAGFITATEEKIKDMKLKSGEDRKLSGWDKYDDILNNFV